MICLSHLIMFHQLSNHIKFLKKSLSFCYTNKTENYYEYKKLHVDCYMIPLFISLEPSFLICCAAKIHFLLCPMLRPIFSKSDSVIEQNVSRQSTPCSTRIFTNSSSANRLMVCWKVPKSNPILLNYYDRNQSCEINNMEINKTHPSIMIKKWSSTKTSAFLYFYFWGEGAMVWTVTNLNCFPFFKLWTPILVQH